MKPEEIRSNASVELEVDAAGATQRFWLSHMRIGFITFLAESLAVLAYLGLTPEGSHRALIRAVVILWIVFGLFGLAVAPAVSGKPWCATYSVAWTVASSFAVACVAVLDGGPNSPIVLLLFLPLIYAALMFTPMAAAICGAGTLAAYLIVVLANSTGFSKQDRSIVYSAVLLGGSVLSVAASINRCRMERHEKKLLEIITDLATYDELTGCLVRRAFHQSVDDEIARADRYRLPLALVMVDVDGFKSINDTFGHVVGDLVLQRVGEVLRETVRSTDSVGRLGGDEFAVLLPNTDVEEARRLAERIRKELSSLREAPMTVSVGVGALSCSRGISSEQLFDDADLALYSVKRSGRNAVAIRDSASASSAGGSEPLSGG